MAGFFGLGLDVGKKTTGSVAKRGPSLSGCDGCQRRKTCEHPDFGVVGKGENTGILVVIEAPTASDDRHGQLLSGDSGRMLYRVLKAAGVCLDDVWVVPAVRCAGGSDPKKVMKDVDFCHQFLMSTINQLQPKVVIPLGMAAIKSIFSDRIRGRLKGTKPSAWMGERIPDQETQRWICPSFSLDTMLAQDDSQDMHDMFFHDIKAAVECTKLTFPIAPTSVHSLFEKSQIITALRHIKSSADWIAFDYETTGLKPHAQGHRIVCASVAWYENGAPRAIAFPFLPDRDFRILWRAILLDSAIGKVAHNNPFEDTWTHYRANIEGLPLYWVQGWVGDTQVESHFQKSIRPNGLKFMTFAKIGVIGYDDDVDEYLKAKGSNGINRIDEVPLKDLLKYNAYDSLYSAILHHDFGPDKSAYERENYGMNLFLTGQSTFAAIQANGFNFDPYECKKAMDSVTSQMVELKDRIQDSDEARKMPRDFNFESPKQLAELLFDKLALLPNESVRSVDEHTLERMGTQFCQDILAFRKLAKIKGTYLDGYVEEAVNGMIHPFFNLTKVVTFRSSSDSPNFQNVPKRNKAVQKIIRSCFRPSPGNLLGEYDYGQIEVRISVSYHKDPNMIRYVHDPTTDMHRDMAAQLFCMDSGEVSSDERQIAKNSYVFPAFYGSGWKMTAPAIWERLKEHALDSLAKHKIRTLSAFSKHVQDVDNDFWGNRFQRYGEWKREVWKFYLKHGYVELYSGFKVYGPMGFTDATNYQIQGSAFHCMLYTLNNVVPRIAAISGRSRVIGQIHDALVVDMHPDDVPEIDRLIWYYGTQKIREVFPWILVPLDIDKDFSEVDGTWSHMNKGGTLSF